MAIPLNERSKAMIVVKEIQLNRFRNTAFVKAYADTKSEVLA